MIAEQKILIRHVLLLALLTTVPASFGQATASATSAAANSAVFTNSSPITIADLGPAVPYGSEIRVDGLGVVRKVSVRLNSLSHDRFDDVGVLLVGPTGAKIRLAVDTGGSHPLDQVDLTIDSTAFSFLPDDSQIYAGAYRPAGLTDEGGGKSHPDDFPAPAPASSYAESLSVLNGTNPNGIWKLYIDDDSGGISGTVAEGWSLVIESSAPTPATANLCGRVVTSEGRGIAIASMMINGGFLTEPLVASTNPFGYFCFPEMYVGQTYTVSTSSKRFSFKSSAHFVMLLEEMNDLRFVADP